MSPRRAGARLLALALLGLFILPLVALAGLGAGDLSAGLESPLFAPALWLSVRTTLVSLAVILCLGTPLAWWLARSTGRTTKLLSLIVDIPIIVPPAVTGIALLQTFGRRGILGPALGVIDVELAFSTAAVVIAQVVVAAPFYVQGATTAFRNVSQDTIDVARTLGASPSAAFFGVALPMALPGLIGAASLAWARALGEFGATLLFAGSLSGQTQTMPLAIFAALEVDLRVAVAFALMLTAMGALLLAALRAIPALLRRRRGEDPI